MKTLKFILCSALLFGSAALITSCNDDDDPRDTLRVTPTSWTFDAYSTDNDEKNRHEFVVSTTADDWAAVLQDINDDWVKIEYVENSFFVTVDDYTDLDATTNRSAKIHVTAGDAPHVVVTINQEYAASDRIRLESYEMIFAADTDLIKSVKIISGIDEDDIEVEITDGEDWIEDAVINDGYLIVTVSANDGARRTGTIELDAEDAEQGAVLTVIQNQYVEPVFDITGDWTLTGMNFDLNTYEFVNYTANVTVTESTALNGFTVGPLRINLPEIGEKEANFLLYVDEDNSGAETVNHIYFRHNVYLQQNLTADMSNNQTGTWRLYNYVFIGEEPGIVELDTDYQVELTISDDMNTITAPGTVTLEGTDQPLSLGIYMEPTDASDFPVELPFAAIKNLRLVRR